LAASAYSTHCLQLNSTLHRHEYFEMTDEHVLSIMGTMKGT
jgi:hypothetical protein